MNRNSSGIVSPLIFTHLSVTYFAQTVDLSPDKTVAEGIESDAVSARDCHDARGRVVRVEPDPEVDLLRGHGVQPEVLVKDAHNLGVILMRRPHWMGGGVFQKADERNIIKELHLGRDCHNARGR